ncbi:MAG: hypothetical protein AAF351_08150 [Pseudomonadota bacterium]
MNKHLSKAAMSVSLLAMMMLSVATPAQASINKDIQISAGSESDGDSSVNGDIRVGSGAVVTGGLSTVNGSITVDSDATVRDVSTVNGSLEIEAGVTTKDLETVNGSITLDGNVDVDGGVEAVNGKIRMKAGSTVADDVSNVNGKINITATEIGGDLSTVSGNITLSDGAVVKGDLIVEEPSGWGWKNRKKPKIVIGPNSRVEGNIVLEQEVDLYISDSAEVGGVQGKMSMSDAMRFDGNSP